MKKLILALAVMAAVTLGQTVSPPVLAPGEVVHVIEVKQADPGSVWNTLNSLLPGISVNGKMLIVRGPEAVVATIEDAIKRLDVPPPPSPEARALPNVEITIQLLYGTDMAGVGSEVPASLEATVRNLRATFSYKNYRILDTQVLRGRDGRGVEASGTLPGDDMPFSIKYTPRVNTRTTPRSVRMERFEFGLRYKIATNPEKTQFQFQQTGIITEIDAGEGQKTVVGKSNMAGSDGAIFLVVTPKIIE